MNSSRLLSFLSIVFMCSPCFGQLGNKGIICDSEKVAQVVESLAGNPLESIDIYGFQFNESIVTGEFLGVYQDNVEIIAFEVYGDYQTTPDKITWWGADWILDRKTLRLTNKYDRSRVFNCIVLEDIETYTEAFNQRRSIEQLKHNEKLIRNKI